MANAVHVLGFAGSLRQGSFNRAALRAAGELLPEGMTLETFDLAPIPLYNGDVEAQGIPEPVTRFQERVVAADALLIVTPEYNYSIPGVLKNAIDWASRPPEKAVFNGKPVAIMGASPAFTGTARAQYHLRQVCVYVNMLPVNKPEVFLSAAHQKFDALGRLTDEPSRKHIRQLLEALAAWVRRLRGEKEAAP
jgi:chromate reductase